MLVADTFPQMVLQGRFPVVEDIHRNHFSGAKQQQCNDKHANRGQQLCNRGMITDFSQNHGC